MAKKKPFTDVRSRAARRRWAARVRPWTVLRNWRHMVFSDEFRVTLFKCDGRTIVWRQENERYLPSCLKLTRLQNRQSVMFWGCIGYGRRGHLVEVQGNMNRHDYIRVLQQHLQPSAVDIFRRQNPNFIFQHDNAPPHTARDTVAWLDQQPFQVMMWPSQSPDMNIIESVWCTIMEKLRADPPSNMQQLRDRVVQHWNEIGPRYLQRLYRQMPRRVEALLAARGYPTKY